MNIALILSGGAGRRFGAEVPKQYHDLCGKPVVQYVVEAAHAAKSIDKVLVVCADEYADWFRNVLKTEVCPSGAERNESFMNGLNYIKANYACEKIMVFDAMRPFVTAELIDEYIARLDEYEVVATCQHIVDSLGCLDSHECDRSRYYILQSPEAFRFELIYSHFKPDSPLVEAYQQLPAQTTLYKNFGFPDNYKLTYYHDISFMRMYMQYKRNKKTENDDTQRVT